MFGSTNPSAIGDPGDLRQPLVWWLRNSPIRPVR